MSVDCAKGWLTWTSRSERSRRLRISIACNKGAEGSGAAIPGEHRATHEINAAKCTLASAIHEVEEVRPLVDLGLRDDDLCE